MGVSVCVCVSVFDVCVLDVRVHECICARMCEGCVSDGAGCVESSRLDMHFLTHRHIYTPAYVEKRANTHVMT